MRGTAVGTRVLTGCGVAVTTTMGGAAWVGTGVRQGGIGVGQGGVSVGHTGSGVQIWSGGVGVMISIWGSTSTQAGVGVTKTRISEHGRQPAPRNRPSRASARIALPLLSCGPLWVVWRTGTLPQSLE